MSTTATTADQAKKEYAHAKLTRAPWTFVDVTPPQQKAWLETRTAFLSTCPAFAHMFYTLCNPMQGEMIAVFTRDIPIAATDGVCIAINPDEFFKFSLQSRVFVVAHEVLHCIFDHCGLSHTWRRTGKVPFSDGTKLPYEGEIMNAAMDYVINDMLVEAKVGVMPPVGLHDKQIAVGDDSVVDAYRKLYQKCGGKASKLPGAGKGFDILLEPGAHSGTPGDKAVQERSQAEWDTALQGAIESARLQGKLPANLARIFGQVLEPKVSWQDHIRGFFARKVGAGSTDWRRADRRLITRGIMGTGEPIVAPGRAGYGANTVVVGVDTSGSINDTTISMFLAEVGGIIDDVRPRWIVLMWVDAKVHEVVWLEDGIDLNRLKPKGGGGTDMGQVFEKIKELELDGIDCCVILTDGYTPFPAKPPGYPVLWGSIALGPEGYPWGEVVAIPQQAK